MRIKFDRWTWPRQKSDRLMGRFGGGWDYKLGIAISSKTVLVDLIWGSVRIDLRRKKYA